MRVLFLLRGCPGVGKSTWIEKNGLQQYTISADNIRLLLQSPLMGYDKDSYQISQKNDNEVWSFLMHSLENRMKRGELSIIDATHSSKRSINNYKQLCQKYRYRCYTIDFTDISLETALERNKSRESYKFVPEDAIKAIYYRYQTQTPPSWVTNIKYNEFDKNKMGYLPTNFDQYNAINIIGDIHGSYDTLKLAINKIREDELYVFVGDYLDRGDKNKEVLEWLIENYNKQNVVLLEGNHEKWLRLYADDMAYEIRSTTFLNKTMKDIEGISKKEIRNVCRKLGQILYFNFDGKEYFVSHGGVPFIPKDNFDILTIASEEFINGVGKYEVDIDTIYNNNEQDIYMIHGHRNSFGNPIANGKSINLQENIGAEYLGGKLRSIRISRNGIEEIYTENTTSNNIQKINTNIINIHKSDEEILESLRKCKYVNEKIIDEISSFNFTKTAFKRKEWTSETITARGLFINNKTNQVIARSYNKFFNVGENDENSINSLKVKLQFPLVAYKKENGFLGMLSWYNNDLFFATKSSIKGDFVNYFKEIFFTIYNENQIGGIKEYLKTHNSTMIFEVVHVEKDSHIIKYDKNELFLLDIVENKLQDAKKVNYNELRLIASALDIKTKEVEKVFDTWIEFYKWYISSKEDFTIEHEGYVLEDSLGYNVKIKTKYYNFWKKWRGLRDSLKRDRNYLPYLETELDCKIFNYLMSDCDNLNKHIIEIRNEVLS